MVDEIGHREERRRIVEPRRPRSLARTQLVQGVEREQLRPGARGMIPKTSSITPSVRVSRYA